MQIKLLCNKFSITRAENKHRQASFLGPVLASNSHVYFFLKTDVGKFANTVSMFSMNIASKAITGGLVDSALREECQITFEDLPDSLRAHPDLAKIKPRTKVIVVPKTEVSSIKVTWYNGACITTDSFKYFLSVGFSTHKEVRRFFADNGWPPSA